MSLAVYTRWLRWSGEEDGVSGGCHDRGGRSLLPAWSDRH